MAHISDRFGSAMRGAWFSLLILAAAALSWQAPQAFAQAAPAPKASLFPPSLAFGSIAVSGSSATQEIALRNTGTGPMSLSGIVSAGGNFDLTHDCPLGTDTLAAGSFCTILVRFAPEAAGLQSGVVQVLDGVLSVVQEIVVTGTGVVAGPKVVPSTTVVTFPTTALFTTSGPLVVMFTNNETVDIWPYFLDYLPVEGEFSPFPGSILIDGGSLAPKVIGSKVVKSCKDAIFNFETLAPGDACFALIYFTPYDVGLRTGSLVLGWDYCGDGCGETSMSVMLQGNAVPFSESDLTVSASQIDFGPVVVGTPGVRTLTVTSTGYGPLTLLGFRALGDIFQVESDCDRVLKTGSSCTVKVTCTPKGFVTVEGDLYIDHDVSPGFTNVKLICTGVERPTPKILVESTGVSFGSLSLGATSEPQEVIISSIGSAPLAITNVGTVPPFAVGGGCPPSLAPGASCVARLTFTPFAPGRQHNALEISSNDPDRPTVTVSLDGIGCRPFSILAARRGLSLCGP